MVKELVPGIPDLKNLEAWTEHLAAMERLKANPPRGSGPSEERGDVLRAFRLYLQACEAPIRFLSHPRRRAAILAVAARWRAIYERLPPVERARYARLERQTRKAREVRLENLAKENAELEKIVNGRVRRGGPSSSKRAIAKQRGVSRNRKVFRPH
jgi:hypothetical protein